MRHLVIRMHRNFFGPIGTYTKKQFQRHWQNAQELVGDAQERIKTLDSRESCKCCSRTHENIYFAIQLSKKMCECQLGTQERIYTSAQAPSHPKSRKRPSSWNAQERIPERIGTPCRGLLRTPWPHEPMAKECVEVHSVGGLCQNVQERMVSIIIFIEIVLLSFRNAWERMDTLLP